MYGKVQQLGQKLSADNILHLGSNFQHNASVGLRKAINTASAVAYGANKAMPYADGVAHALGVGEATLPILGGVSKGLKNSRKARNIFKT